MNNFCKFQKEDFYLISEEWRRTSVSDIWSGSGECRLDRVLTFLTKELQSEGVHNLGISAETFLLRDLGKNRSDSNWIQSEESQGPRTQTAIEDLV